MATKEFLELAMAYKAMLKDAQDTFIFSTKTTENSIIKGELTIWDLHNMPGLQCRAVFKYNINGKDFIVEGEFDKLDVKGMKYDHDIEQFIKNIVAKNLAQQILSGISINTDGVKTRLNQKTIGG